MVTTSAARIEANRKNSAPCPLVRRTEEAGKAVSRMNALRHGMAGSEHRSCRMKDRRRGRPVPQRGPDQQEMKPRRPTMGVLLIKQIAL